MTTERKSEEAHHEAGHCVMGYLFRYSLLEVSLKKGRTSIKPVLLGDTNDEMTKYFIYLLIGSMAADKYAKCEWSFWRFKNLGGKRDFLELKDLLKNCYKQGQRKPILSKAVSEAKNFLNQDRVWQTIKVSADKLFRVDEISGEELNRILEDELHDYKEKIIETILVDDNDDPYEDVM